MKCRVIIIVLITLVQNSFGMQSKLSGVKIKRELMGLGISRFVKCLVKNFGGTSEGPHEKSIRLASLMSSWKGDMQEREILRDDAGVRHEIYRVILGDYAVIYHR